MVRAMNDLLTRLLALAELAVSEALEFEYYDPEHRHIWRELQELKPLVQQALEQEAGR
jgi:hemerythrin-like domain-containing protein